MACFTAAGHALEKWARTLNIVVVVVGLAIVGAKHAFDCMLTDDTSYDDCMFVWISMASLKPLTTCLIVGLFIPNDAMLITAISATFNMLSSM